MPKQKKTKQQKKRMQEKKQQTYSYVAKIESPLIKKNNTINGFFSYDVSLIYKDMLKTLVISFILITSLVGIFITIR